MKSLLFINVSCDENSDPKFPLVVDLDGTLILTDLGRTSLTKFIFQFPHKIAILPLWLAKGRAYIKSRLADHVAVTPGDLIYSEPVLQYIKRYKENGHQVLLATGADIKYAQTIAAHVGLFDQVLASEGMINNISHTKAQRLSDLFGEEKFVYIGNSAQDLAVWAKAAHAVAVNAPPQF